MSAAPVDPRCARCGIAASKRPDNSSPPLECAQCRHVDLCFSFCNQACFDAGIKRHRETVCVGEKNQVIFTDDAKQWKQFCTPACRVELVTPRLRLRPVELSDTDRSFCIKTDPLVYRGQLYDEPYSTDEVLLAFVSQYTANAVPTLSSAGSSCKGRQRYMFAIEPRLKDGVRMVQPNRELESRYDLDAEGFIGNLCISIEPNERGQERRIWPLLEPKAGQVFRYPPKALEPEAHGEFFYEIHPKFWKQGIATEFMKQAISYAFKTLQLPYLLIDPLSTNTASIALVKKLGFTFVETVHRKPPPNQHKSQEVYKLTRAEWEKSKKGKGKKKKGKAAPESAGDGAGDPPEVVAGGKEGLESPPTCRWCQVPDNKIGVSCSGCDWAFWCSQACKTADLLFRGGHSLECPGRGGDPSRSARFQVATIKRENEILRAMRGAMGF
ncbi:hypothetical protein JCM6882_006380 [Rhodosporidiobolus microsporus]